MEPTKSWQTAQILATDFSNLWRTSSTSPCCISTYNINYNFTRRNLNLDTVDTDSGTKIMYAITFENIDYVQRFLEAGGNPNMDIMFLFHERFATGPRNNFCSGTLLHLAASCSSIDITRLLIEYGANVNAITYWSSYPPLKPLLLAVRRLHFEITSILIANGADVEEALIQYKKYDTPANEWPEHNRMLLLLQDELLYRKNQSPPKTSFDNEQLERAIQRINQGGAAFLKAYLAENPNQAAILFPTWLNKAVQEADPNLLDYVLTQFPFDSKTLEKSLALADSWPLFNWAYSRERDLIIQRLNSEIDKRKTPKQNSNFDNDL